MDVNIFCILLLLYSRPSSELKVQVVVSLPRSGYEKYVRLHEEDGKNHRRRV